MMIDVSLDCGMMNPSHVAQRFFYCKGVQAFPWLLGGASESELCSCAVKKSCSCCRCPRLLSLWRSFGCRDPSREPSKQSRSKETWGWNFETPNEVFNVYQSIIPSI